MKEDRKKALWLGEYRKFLTCEPISPPQELGNAILSKIRAELNPSFSSVSARLFTFHALSVTAITLFCPQLGVGPVFGGDSIMYLFMRFGPLPCAALCGALLMGGSMGVAAVSLKREELKIAYNHRFFFITLLLALSFSGLMLIGGQAVQWSYVLWNVGGFLAAWSVLASVARLRQALPSWLVT